MSGTQLLYAEGSIRNTYQKIFNCELWKGGGIKNEFLRVWSPKRSLLITWFPEPEVYFAFFPAKCRPFSAPTTSITTFNTHTHSCLWQPFGWPSASLLPQSFLLGCQTLASLCNANCDVKAWLLPSDLLAFLALYWALTPKSVANTILGQKEIFFLVYLYVDVNYLSVNP
jgi:hypothetical protein